MNGQFKMIDKRCLRVLGFHGAFGYILACRALNLIGKTEKEQWLRWICRSY